MLMRILIVAALIASACSSPRPSAGREDAVMSGEETAKKAGEAARKADEKDETGILTASSQAEEAEPPEPSTQPAVPTPTVEDSTLHIEMKKGTPTVNGEPVPANRIEEMVREAVEQNPDLFVVVIRDADTGPKATADVVKAARSGGAELVEERQKID